MHEANAIFREVMIMIAHEKRPAKRRKIVKRMVKMQVNKETCPMCKAHTVDIDGMHHECANGHFWFFISEAVPVIREAHKDSPFIRAERNG